MKKIILISMITSFIGCVQEPLKMVYIDKFRPTIDSTYGGYYVTRVAAFKSDSVVYPTTKDEAVLLEKRGFVCNKYSVPVEYLNK